MQEGAGAGPLPAFWRAFARAGRSKGGCPTQRCAGAAGVLAGRRAASCWLLGQLVEAGGPPGVAQHGARGAAGAGGTACRGPAGATWHRLGCGCGRGIGAMAWAGGGGSSGIVMERRACGGAGARSAGGGGFKRHCDGAAGLRGGAARSDQWAAGVYRLVGLLQGQEDP